MERRGRFAAGEGNRKLFESFGAHVVEGGQSMNPSVGDLATLIDRDLARGVIVLPNNSNVIGAAEHAADQAEVEAHVLPTRSMQEGLSAVVVCEIDPWDYPRGFVDFHRDVWGLELPSDTVLLEQRRAP